MNTRLLLSLFFVASTAFAGIPDYHSWGDADWYYFCRTPSLWYMEFDNYGHQQINAHQPGGDAYGGHYDPAVASAPYYGPLVGGAAPVNLGDTTITTPAPSLTPPGPFVPIAPPAPFPGDYSVTTPNATGWSLGIPQLSLGNPLVGVAAPWVFNTPDAPPVSDYVQPVMAPGESEDNWGCQVAVCTALGVWYWDVAECVSVLTKLVTHLRRHSWPSCP